MSSSTSLVRMRRYSKDLKSILKKENDDGRSSKITRTEVQTPVLSDKDLQMLYTNFNRLIIPVGVLPSKHDNRSKKVSFSNGQLKERTVSMEDNSYNLEKNDENIAEYVRTPPQSTAHVQIKDDDEFTSIQSRNSIADTYHVSYRKNRHKLLREIYNVKVDLPMILDKHISQKRTYPSCAEMYVTCVIQEHDEINQRLVDYIMMNNMHTQNNANNVSRGNNNNSCQNEQSNQTVSSGNNLYTVGPNGGLYRIKPDGSKQYISVSKSRR